MNLPCPFCGGEPALRRSAEIKYFHVKCGCVVCEMVVKTCDFETAAEAWAAWNRRAR